MTHDSGLTDTIDYCAADTSDRTATNMAAVAVAADNPAVVQTPANTAAVAVDDNPAIAQPTPLDTAAHNKSAIAQPTPADSDNPAIAQPTPADNNNPAVAQPTPSDTAVVATVLEMAKPPSPASLPVAHGHRA
jgi:hypothetical protein